MNAEILIIEDDPVIRKELRILLEGNGYHVFVIEDFTGVAGQVKKSAATSYFAGYQTAGGKWIYDLFGNPGFFTGSDRFRYKLGQRYG